MMVRYISTQHPKKSILFKPELVQKMLNMGWVAQPKYNGENVQVHVVGRNIYAFSRHGRSRKLSPEIEEDILNNFSDGFVFEAEYRNKANKLCIFDCIKTSNDGLMSSVPYIDRHSKLPLLATPNVLVVPVLSQIGRMKYWYEHPETEGLVFKSGSPGFSNSSVIRCRRNEMKDMSLANRLRGK